MVVRPDVAVVVPALDVGGTERHLLTMLPRIQASGLGVCVFVLDGYGVLTTALRDAGVTVALAPDNVSTARRMLALWHWLRSERPRIVHFFLPKAYLLGSLCRPRGTPAILSRRSLNRYQARRPLARVAERLAHKYIHLALANSRAIADELAGEGIAPDKLRVIYNGVAAAPAVTPSTRAGARAALALAADDVVYLMVANLLPYKGHADVIAALAVLEGRLERPWQVLFVGAERGIGRALHDAVEAAGLGRRVRWCGAVEDIAPYLVAADIALLASHEEGLSSFILEAMAAGLPVIATAVGGNGEAVRDGEDGILVPPQAPQQLAAAMATLGDNPALRETCGNSARKRATELFSIDRCLHGYLSAYAEILQPDPAGQQQ